MSIYDWVLGIVGAILVLDAIFFLGWVHQYRKSNKEPLS